MGRKAIELLQSTDDQLPIATKGRTTMGKAEENAAIVRRGYVTFNAADMKALTDIWHTSALRPVTRTGWVGRAV